MTKEQKKLYQRYGLIDPPTVYEQMMDHCTEMRRLAKEKGLVIITSTPKGLSPDFSEIYRQPLGIEPVWTDAYTSRARVSPGIFIVNHVNLLK